MVQRDTIVAAATPPGKGGVAIVRVSGEGVPVIARALLGELPPARHARFMCWHDADEALIDAGIVLLFPAPQSYTGEHVLELHGHGGMMILESLIGRCVELGARRAAPGEFTQRAYLHDKLDLVQAEAVADLIDAGSQEAARAAVRSLQGEFSAMVEGLVEAVTELRTYIEAAIDFPEEEVDFLGDLELANRLQSVREHFEAVTQSARQGQILRDGMTIVIAGRPNAGKSSLLNRLVGYEAAIVTAIPGTTRDIVRERIHIDGMPLHVLDTAGLRPAEDVVEAEGIRRAQAEIARADRILFVIDVVADPNASAYVEEKARIAPNVPVTLVFNKCDLASGLPVADTAAGPVRLNVSALTGQGMEALRAHLKLSMGYQTSEGGTISARQRHLEALARARLEVEQAAKELAEHRAGELVAEHLRGAQQALGEISGETSSDDLLGRIFSSFCIGK